MAKEFKINSDLQTYLSKIDILRTLVRYQTCLKNLNESVAEHSFYVAAIVLKLSEYYDFDLTTALITAIIHDIPEASISDVPFNIKQRNPELCKALEDVEAKVTTTQLSEEAAELIKHFNECDTPEGLACRLADILSVVLYSADEIKTGNKIFNYIAIKTLKRCSDVLQQLEKYIKKPYTKEQIADKINQIMNIY